MLLGGEGSHTADVKRNLETGGGIYLDKWWTGLYQNRSPLFTPVSAMGIQMIARQDALWDGRNMMITPQFTLRRRYGFLRYCSSAFGSSEWPLTYYSFQNLSGTITPIVDTQSTVYSFTPTSKTSIFTKSTTAQSSFEDVGNILYWCDGTSSKKWNGATVTNWGIAAPTVAPTLSFSSGSLSPTVGYQYVYVYRNSSTGHISTASPTSANTGPQTSKNISVGYTASTDAQVDKIDIYRNDDGGAVYYFLAEVSNATSSYTDSTPDAGLDDLLIAPVADVNNPPPSGMSLTVWYAGRLWGASGNTLYYSGGPDTLNGVGPEAWPPINNFPVPGNITALASTSQGLIVWTTDDAYVVLGTNASTFTAPQLWQANWGVANQNCVCQDGDNLFIYTTRGQMWSYSASGLQEIGFMEGTQLGAFTPANVYITIHRSGEDEGIFVSDGSSNIYRYSQVASAWDTVIQPVGGVGCIESIEVTAGNWRLMAGRPTGSGYILDRDTSTFTDDGSTYPAWATVGSLMVAPPRQVANIASVLIDATAIGTYPTVSVLLNETTDLGSAPATFITLPNPVPDPPQLAASQSIWMKRHDLKAAQYPLSGHVRHMQVKIAFPSEAHPNELLGLGLA